MDVVLAVAVGVVSMQSAFDAHGLKTPAWAVIGLIQLSVLPLAFRRVRPVPVFAVTLAAAVAGFLAFDGFQVAGPLIALYTVARLCERPVATAAAATGVVAALLPAAADRSPRLGFDGLVAVLFAAARDTRRS